MDANKRSRRDKPMVPKEPVVLPPSTLPRPSITLSIPEADYENFEEPLPVPIIVATRVEPDDIENIHLRAQAKRKRRVLPPTPEDHPFKLMGYRMRNSHLWVFPFSNDSYQLWFLTLSSRAYYVGRCKWFYMLANKRGESLERLEVFTPAVPPTPKFWRRQVPCITDPVSLTASFQRE